MDGRIKKLFGRTVIFTASKFVSKLIAVCMIRIYTGVLSEGEYGTVNLLTDMANLLIPIVCLGINEGIFRNAAAKSGNPKEFFSCGMAIFGFGTLGFLALSPLLGLIPFATEYVWLVVLYVLISNIHAICSQYICADGHEKLFAVQGIINTALNVGFAVLFLLGFKWGIVGYLFAIVAADGLTALILVIKCRLWRCFSFSLVSRATMKKMLGFSIPLIPTTVFWWVTGASDRYFVQYVCGDDMNGLYSAAYKIPTLLLFAVTVFNEAWKLSAVETSGDRAENAKLFDKVYKYYLGFMFTGGALIIAASYPLACLLFGASFRSAWIYIPILVAATVCSAIDSFFGTVYYVAGRTVYSFWTSLVGAVLNVGLNMLLIPMDNQFGGAVGASIATFISYFAVMVLRIITSRNLIKFDLHPICTAVNTVLLVELAGVLTLYGVEIIAKPAAIAGTALLTVLITAYNCKRLYNGIRSTLREYLTRKSLKKS